MNDPRQDTLTRARVAQLIESINHERAKRYRIVKGLSIVVAAQAAVTLLICAIVFGAPLGASRGLLGERDARLDAINRERARNTLNACVDQNARHDATLKSARNLPAPARLLVRELVDQLAPRVDDCAADTRRKVRR